MKIAVNYVKRVWLAIVSRYRGVEVPDVSYFNDGWWGDGGYITLSWGDYFGEYVSLEVHPSGDVDTYTRHLGQPVQLWEQNIVNFEPPAALSQFLSVTDEQRLAKFWEYLKEIEVM